MKAIQRQLVPELSGKGLLSTFLQFYNNNARDAIFLALLIGEPQADRLRREV
jgi:hypothetical protein